MNPLQQTQSASPAPAREHQVALIQAGYGTFTIHVQAPWQQDMTKDVLPLVLTARLLRAHAESTSKKTESN